MMKESFYQGVIYCVGLLVIVSWSTCYRTGLSEGMDQICEKICKPEDVFFVKNEECFCTEKNVR